MFVIIHEIETSSFEFQKSHCHDSWIRILVPIIWQSFLVDKVLQNWSKFLFTALQKLFAKKRRLLQLVEYCRAFIQWIRKIDFFLLKSLSPIDFCFEHSFCDADSNVGSTILQYTRKFHKHLERLLAARYNVAHTSLNEHFLVENLKWRTFW